MDAFYYNKKIVERPAGNLKEYMPCFSKCDQKMRRQYEGTLERSLGRSGFGLRNSDACVSYKHIQANHTHTS